MEIKTEYHVRIYLITLNKMECLRCGKESKYEFCRKCKLEKHRAGALISQNKKKLRNLLDKNILEPELFNRFILYTDNIITQ